MAKLKIFWTSLLDAVATTAYICGVAWFMFNGEKFFGKAESALMPASLLLLFVLSATITGALVLGMPIYYYLGGLKKEAVILLSATVGWMALFTILFLLSQIF